jgi:ribosomal protein S21
MATPKKSPSATNTAPSSLPYSASSIMNSISRDLTSPPPARPALRLNPTTGRTVSVGGNVDVGRAFRLLETSCARNKVRTEFNYQRFHERPGLKRKRLHSKRWRVRFMEGFRATVGRVKHLKSQGW